MRTVSILLIPVAMAAGCAEPPKPVATAPPGSPGSPQAERDVAAFLGTVEDREARAPYSPPGWPLQPGDVILDLHESDAEAEFPDWNGIADVFWLDTIAFGSAFEIYWPRGVTSLANAGRRYLGHFPQQVPAEYYGHYWYSAPLPPHLAGESAEDVKRWLYADETQRSRVWTGGPLLPEAAKTEWSRERWIAGYTGAVQSK